MLCFVNVVVFCKWCKKILKMVWGYFGVCSKVYIVVKNVVEKGLVYVYCDCKVKKCVFCCFWIVCINVVVC